MAKALLECETIDADQIDDIMAGRAPRPPKQPPAGAASPPPPAAGTADAVDQPRLTRAPSSPMRAIVISRRAPAAVRCDAARAAG